MDNKAKINALIRRGARINIIGDSLAAGAGCSEHYKTEAIILEDGNNVYYRRIAPNSWWGKFKTYLEEKFPGCNVINSGCGGIFSSQVRDHLNSLYEENDDIIIILLGANDRKLQNGMNDLRDNLTFLVQHFKSIGKQVILMTPNPSTVNNDSYENRIFHMEDVANVVTSVALDEHVLLVNHFNYIQEYLFLTEKKIDDIIFGDKCGNDGLHPSDRVQNLMYRNLLNCLELSQKVDHATW